MNHTFTISELNNSTIQFCKSQETDKINLLKNHIELLEESNVKDSIIIREIMAFKVEVQRLEGDVFNKK